MSRADGTQRAVEMIDRAITGPISMAKDSHEMVGFDSGP